MYIRSFHYETPCSFRATAAVKVRYREYRLGSAIKNLGLFSKSPGDFKMETMDF